MKGKEVKIGLSVIAVLLCIFGVVLFTRLRDGDSTPKIASKPSSRAKAGAKKKDKETGKGEKSNFMAPSAAKQAANSRSGPSLTLEVPVERRSFANSSREEEEHGMDDSSSRSAKLSALASPFGQQGAEDEEPAESVDRYGRRYRLANDSQAGNSGPYPEDAAGAEVANEMASDEAVGDDAADDPLASDDEASGDDAETRGAALSLGAGRDARYGQPADGYRTIENETAEEPAAEAADDPFPSASAAPFAIREPAKSGSLKASAEVQLAPIDETDDASIAGAEALDRGKYGSGRRSASASLSGKGGFSTASRRSAAALAAELEEEANLTSDDPFARSAGEGAPHGAYVVQAGGDSFAKISKKVYGTEGYFKALHEYNREQYPNPNLIDIGDEIAVPDVAVLQQKYPALCPKPRGAPAEPRGGAMRLASRGNSARGGRAYLVAEGDTLFDIAKRELGKASRWKEIYDLNQDQLGEDFNYLSPGTELLLPGAGDKPDPVADRPSLDRRRR